MASPGANSKCCCNCQFWDGPRKVCFSKDRAEVKSMSDQGVCTNKKTTNLKGNTYKADHMCPTSSYFVKWDQLK